MSQTSICLKEIGLKGYQVIGIEESRDVTTLLLLPSFNERAQGCPYCKAEGTESDFALAMAVSP